MRIHRLQDLPNIYQHLPNTSPSVGKDISTMVRIWDINPSHLLSLVLVPEVFFGIPLLDQYKYNPQYIG